MTETTTSGDVILHMLRFKDVSFETAIIERYRHWESSAEEALIEMSMSGVFVRIHSLSKGSIESILLPFQQIRSTCKPLSVLLLCRKAAKEKAALHRSFLYCLFRWILADLHDLLLRGKRHANFLLFG